MTVAKVRDVSMGLGSGTGLDCKQMCVLTGYHASEGGRGVAALSSGGDMRRVAWQSGAGEVSTWNHVVAGLVHSTVRIPSDIFICC